uniref:Uncharacterized protein n=1 Tax=Vespula pensylvanica TaxID=30213 RepID=A0A834N2K9_VESPE|nr:hypothetical protein H0235_017020 [Vespula pensylvanica]
MAAMVAMVGCSLRSVNGTTMDEGQKRDVEVRGNDENDSDIEYRRRKSKAEKRREEKRREEKRREEEIGIGVGVRVGIRKRYDERALYPSYGLLPRTEIFHVEKEAKREMKIVGGGRWKEEEER